VGGRFSSDLKKLDFTHFSDSALDFTFNPGTDPTLARQKFNDWSGKLSLEYRPNSNTLGYVSISRGTKSGGFGTQAFTPIDPTTLPFNSEVLVNYEAGLKLTLFDRTTTINTAIFHYDYRDYQAFTFVGLSQFIVNRPAKVTGAEMEVSTRPVEGLNLRVFGTYLETKVSDIILPFGRTADRVLPQAPELSLGALARYEFPLGPGIAALQTDWKYDSSQFFSTVNAPVDLQGARTVGNVRASYALDDGHWEFAVFANNVTDTNYRIYSLDLSLALGIANQTFARPRWFGASATYRIF
jgi:iron complex outermembrane receptor protein